MSIGTHLLLRSEPLVIDDLTTDRRFDENTFIKARGFRFYAGISLAVASGHRVGTLCLMDEIPHVSTPDLGHTLRHLATIIESLMDVHGKAEEARTLAARIADDERAIRQKTKLVAQTERMAKIGAWELDLVSGALVMSDECYRIHDLEVGAAITADVVRAHRKIGNCEKAEALLKAASEKSICYETTAEIVTALGHRRHVEMIVDLEKKDGVVVRSFGTIRDVTKEHDASQTLWNAAHFDALTTVPNRYYWTARLAAAFETAIADHGHLSIIILDLDGFKEINDTRGHAAGDHVLREIARRVGAALPPNAFHARLGGDEFAVLLVKPDQTDLDAVVEAVLKTIRDPIGGFGAPIRVSATFGSATFPSDAQNADELMRKADIALYQAKRSQRTPFVPFRDEIGRLFDHKHLSIAFVTEALDKKRIVPFYQPKIDLRDGRVVGFEALCRIEAEDGTILGPGQFHPAFDHPDTSVRIGTAMLDLVTADLAEWLKDDLSPGPIAINVAGPDFANGDLADRILSILRSRNLPASLLEIEVTENTILGKEAKVVGAALQTLNENGIIVSLDDFGTGFASLIHLRDASIKGIKLDRSFIAALGSSADSAIIIKSVVDMCRGLNLRIVAEGIETDVQADFLRSIGCTEAQGFLFGRPMSRASTRILLQAQDFQRRMNGLRIAVRGKTMDDEPLSTSIVGALSLGSLRDLMAIPLASQA